MSQGSPVLAHYRQQADQALTRELQQLPADCPSQLADALRYSVLLGGKRIRPALVLATAHCLNAPLTHALPAACAVELIHAYSLVHDDLPAMDNDSLRRGQPTCHIAFGEATAVLAGDGLQALAFACLTRSPLSDRQKLAQVTLLANASGAGGMVGGQAIDLHAVGRTLSLEQLKTMHRLKTGALIQASVELGAISAGNDDPEVRHALRQFADGIGLAFQIQDDILDVEGTTAEIGKTRGADASLNKPTFPAIIGLDASRRLLTELMNDVRGALHTLPATYDTKELTELAAFIVERRT